MTIEKFLKPAIGDTSLSRLAQLGARPFEQLYAELPSAVQGADVHRAPYASGARVRRAVRAASVPATVGVTGAECHAVLSGALNAALR